LTLIAAVATNIDFARSAATFSLTLPSTAWLCKTIIQGATASGAATRRGAYGRRD